MGPARASACCSKPVNSRSLFITLGGRDGIWGWFLVLCLLACGYDKDVESQAHGLRRQELVPCCWPLGSLEGGRRSSRYLRSDKLTRKEGMIRANVLPLHRLQNKVLLTEVLALRTFSVRSIVAMQLRSIRTFCQMHHSWWSNVWFCDVHFIHEHFILSQEFYSVFSTLLTCRLLFWGWGERKGCPCGVWVCVCLYLQALFQIWSNGSHHACFF